MEDSSPRRSTMLLHIVLGLILAVEGALVMVRGFSVAHDSLLVLFGAVELVSAAFFVWPRTVRLGACGLICAFLVAAVFHISHGEFPSEHLVAAVAVALVAVHSTGESSRLDRAAA